MLKFEQFKKYYSHVLGINLLNIWCLENKCKIKIHDEIVQEINLPLFVSNKFRLGLSLDRKINKHYVYLTAERNEANWLKRIQWNKLILNIKQKEIILTSKFIEGDLRQIPDFPVFLLRIPYDFKEKINLFKKLRTLTFQEMSIDNGDISVGKQKFWTIPVEIYNDLEKRMLKREDYRHAVSLKEINDKLINESNRNNVEYQGEEVVDFIDPTFNSNFTKKFNDNDYSSIYGDQFKKTPSYISDIMNNDYGETDYSHSKDLTGRTKEEIEKFNENFEFN